jgi:hypothetical protein
MRKLVIAGLVVGLMVASVTAANADPLSDWIASLFGFAPTAGDPGVGAGPRPNSGGGDGSDQQ